MWVLYQYDSLSTYKSSAIPFLEASKLSWMFILWMSYVNVVFGSRVLFLLIVFKANLKASSSAPDGPVSIDSNIPPGKKKKKKRKQD